MQVTVKYFGQVAEITECNNECFTANKAPIATLLELIYTKHPSLKGISFSVAQNQELVDIDTTLTGQEIALLPPFAGG